jgi:ABC-type uncharacterized transport system ATPase subunit
VELLKKRRWLLNYGREVSVATRLSHAEKQALEICMQLSKTEDCIAAVDAAAGDGYQAIDIIYRESNAKGA